MVELLSEQYDSVFSPPLENYSNLNLEHMKPERYSIMPEVIVNENKLEAAFSKMKCNAAPGSDGLTGGCLKRGGQLVKDALVDIFNHSIQETAVPSQARVAWISPTWKGKRKDLTENYRPIALTNQLFKILESIIRVEIIKHLEDIGMVDPAQHGSTKCRSTLTQLIEQQEEILKILEKGSNVDLIYLDFAKAYDKIDHKILLEKLKILGITGKTLEWIECWLTEKVQRVRIGQNLSTEKKVRSGIPQGSVLGPLMFILYIWDLNIKNVHEMLDPTKVAVILKYVDDTRLIFESRTEEDVICAQEMLNCIYAWQSYNNMQWNSTKFVRISMGSNVELKNVPLFTPEYQDVIEQKESTRDLGVIIDDSLRFASQRQAALLKARKKCGWVLRVFWTREEILWRSLIQPLQDYASQLWCPAWDKGDLALQESPLRMYSKKIVSCKNLNYWQRLIKIRMLSTNRRT